MAAFTTIALTTLSAAGAGFSFAEAGKQNKLARARNSIFLTRKRI